MSNNLYVPKKSIEASIRHEFVSLRVCIRVTHKVCVFGCVCTTLPKQVLQLQNKPGLVGPCHGQNMLSYGIYNKRSIS